ncbi:helix-turn-helix transcriptional regulator [Chitinophaga nivalis]|uniref:Helix-turn-helix transcriptional regulator n=1 Tax=Chitinophaga nivalis TaxID=2991709 RepID=A0ABT3IPW3_9BACT|nr:helix-turn-helix transcriptional regulator [Chitinophaga nivalis]MCW3464525.1 helix-turn-helix transcriptional regulator [Chitinophaga nivalis]MCW3485784.1 helix-turn-helix transcriptional regulator [Chitinophaga nivalis]
MEFTKIHIQRNDLRESAFDAYREISNDVSAYAARGNRMCFQEVSFRNLQFIRCDYTLTGQEQVALDIREEVFEMHFRLAGATAHRFEGETVRLNSQQHSICYHDGFQTTVAFDPTDAPGAFLEIRMNREQFTHLFAEGNTFQQLFLQQITKKAHVWPGYHLPVTPAMQDIIQAMSHSPYSGHLKSLHLEAKMLELLLLQVAAFDAPYGQTAHQLKQADIDCLYAAKAYIDTHYHTGCTIATIAAAVGINERKLTRGFKALFNTTVFDYLTELRMITARQLLLDHKMYVGEVSDMIGYKHQQHFTAAFKKRFGILPGKLRE